MDSEFLKEINCVYLSTKQVVCIRWIQNWIIGSEWFHIFVHNMEATVVSNLERSVAWEGFCPLKTGIEEVTRYVQISVSRLQRNHICFFPEKKTNIQNWHSLHKTQIYSAVYITLKNFFLIDTTFNIFNTYNMFNTYISNESFGTCTTYLGTILGRLLAGLLWWLLLSGLLDGDFDLERFLGAAGLSFLSLLSLSLFLSLSLSNLSFLFAFPGFLGIITSLNPKISNIKRLNILKDMFKLFICSLRLGLILN